MKYLLIDGNNLAVRAAFANEDLQNNEGECTSVHFGFNQSLILLRKRFPDHRILVAWDGKSKRRMDESREGVNKHLIPSAYKENRDKENLPKPLKDFFSQSDYLKKAIHQLGIAQIRMPEFEADDVLASYAHYLKDEHEVTICTSDKDYWQLLDDNVILWDGMKMQETTKADWVAEYGIQPENAVDVGALMGDNGDNIFGIPGWGEKTAFKEIKKHETWEKLYEGLHEKYDKLKDKYPDIKDWAETEETKSGGVDMEKVRDYTFNDLSSIKANPDNPNSKLKYPGIYSKMPFSGVLEAFEKGEVKMPKATMMALCFEERVRLAYSLKKMDVIDGLPDIPEYEFNQDKVLDYFEYYDIHSLMEDIKVFSPDYDGVKVGQGVDILDVFEGLATEEVE
tara:strand:- start:11987 stop:13171 length:1185 start_codon:yes stop_codon:yes gene_type:complete